ncbi:MAG: apolipoprotein N-acyltransferase [Actinomycetes bacterium]
MTEGLAGRLVMAAVAGLLLAVSLPPWRVWPAAVIGLASLGGTLRGRSWLRRAALGAAAGAVWFGITLRWVAAFTVPGAVLLVAVQAAFPAVAAALTPSGRGRWLAFPGALVLVEALRYRWPLGGVPLSSLALGQVEGPLREAAGIVGPLGMLLALAGAASVLGGGLGTTRGRPVVGALAAVAIVVAPTLLPTAPGTQPTGPPMVVAAVQGGGPRGIPAVLADVGEPDRVFERHLEVGRQAGDGLALLLWPEDTVDVPGRFTGSSAHRQLAALAADLDTRVVAGVVEDAGDSSPGLRRFRNAAVVVGADGRIVARYDKVLRVPFGEYVPWRAVLDRFVDLSLIPRDAVPGTGVGLLSTPQGDLGVMVSFEGLFPDRARAAVRAGGQLLLLPTNASSYVTDDVPAQELAAARLRALETGRAVAMAAPTGYSAVIEADGTILAQSELETPALVRAAITPRTGRTPYVVMGDGPVVVAGLLLVALGWGRARRPKRIFR